MAIDMDEALIDYMNGPGDPNVTDDEGLGQLLRMTRNDGMGIEAYREAYRIALTQPPETEVTLEQTI